jgi:DsbC/DsbD-like thiol-disulfide interchange protein
MAHALRRLKPCQGVRTFGSPQRGPYPSPGHRPRLHPPRGVALPPTLGGGVAHSKLMTVCRKYNTRSATSAITDFVTVSTRHKAAAKRILWPTCLLPLLFLPLAFAARASTSPASSLHAKTELIAEKDFIEPAQTLWLGLHFELESGWHIYWINPGDSGEPPRVQWHLPTGFLAGAIQWPAPQRIEDHSLVDYGYEGEALLMVPVQAPAHLTGREPVKFEAALKWLVCREICIPERADLALSLPVQEKGARQQPHWQELFTRTRARLPKPAPRDWRTTALSEKEQFVLGIETGSPEPRPTFFPLEPNQIENAAPQELVRLARGVSLKLRKSDQLLRPLSRLKGVVELGSGRAFVVDAPVLAPNSQ